jgi:hypothetical protein
MVYVINLSLTRKQIAPRLTTWTCRRNNQVAPNPPFETVAQQAKSDWLSEIYAREGVDLERSTLADWVGQSSQLLRPLFNALEHHVVNGHKVHVDDTPIGVLAPGNGKTKMARLWTYVRDDRPAGDATPAAVWFAYSPDRKGQHPRAHLKHFSGILQADGYAGFAQLYATGTIEEAACWAHARRKFYDVYKDQASPLAGEALQRIAVLYAIESEIGGQPLDQRKAVR